MYKEALEVVGDIYEAAYRPEYWPEALKRVCQLINASSAGLFIRNHQSKTTINMYGYGLPKAGIFAYNHGFANLDPGFKIMKNEPVGRTRMILNPDEPGFRYGVFHNVVNKAAKIHYMAGMNVFNDEFWHVGLGLHRRKRDGVFEDEKLEVIEALLPHFQRALRIHREFSRLRLREQLLAEGLSRSMLGVVLLDDEGQPVYLNPVAEVIIETHPAISLSDRGITVHDYEQKKQFKKNLRQMLSGSSKQTKGTKSLIVKHPEKRLPLAMMLAPYEEVGLDIYTMSAAPQVMMYISDPDIAIDLSAEALEGMYGLSDAEAAVATAIVNGMTVEQIANVNHVSVNTVKTQLKSIFRKTDCNRQADLVRLLLNSTAADVPV